jgi:hypothetical protein
MALWYAFAIPVLLVERASARQALKRSRELTKDYLGRICLVWLLMIMVSWTVSGLVQGPFVIAFAVLSIKGAPPAYWLTVLTIMAGGAAGILTSPLLSIPMVLLYYDSRARKEGYDLEVLLEALPQARSVPAPRPGPVAEQTPCLESTSVPWVVFLSLVTLGLYVPLWVLSRRRALNNLRSTEKLNLGTLSFVLSMFILCWAAGIAAGALRDRGSESAALTFGQFGEATLFIGAIELLFQLFKVRRILMDHFCVTSLGPFSLTVASQSEAHFSGVATFFLGIYYLQYKINRLLEVSAPTAT